MSYKGHLICRQCKLKLCLGKLLSESYTLVGKEERLGFGFPGLTADQLGKVVLQFIAQHVDHDLFVAGDPVVDTLPDLAEYDMLYILDDASLWARTHEAVFVGGVKFYRIPCEPPEERAKRKTDPPHGPIIKHQ